jgi:REP element-mobilizing transposase RayT
MLANFFTCGQGYSFRMSPDWPHAPVHRLDSQGIYIVTAATLYKKPFFASEKKLTLLEDSLLSLAKQYQWQLEAWAVFPNHYHFVARSGNDSASLKRLLKHLHADSARELIARMTKAAERCGSIFGTPNSLTSVPTLHVLIMFIRTRETWLGCQSKSVSLVLSSVV